MMLYRPSSGLFTQVWMLITLLMTSLVSQASLLDEYIYETWTSKQGLPHNSINAIAQTEDGYLWFATWEGIARFNGREFTHFTRDEHSKMRDSGTRALYADTNGGLLAGGARGGIVYREPGNWQAVAPFKNLVNALLREKSGGMWVGLQGLGLVYRSDLEAKNQVILPSVSVYKLYQSRNGDVLASTSKGLYRVSNGQPKLISQRDRKVFSAAEDSQGRIIYGGDDGAWQFYNGKISRIDERLNHFNISNVLVDNQGQYWFGTVNQGIYRYFNSRLASLTERDGLPHSRILSLFQDREASIWIGTNTGLTRLRHAPFRSWDTTRGMSGDYVRTVMPLDGGQTLVGTSSGLSVLDGKKVTNITSFDEQKQTQRQLSILSLAPSNDGGAWVGSYSHGVFSYQNKTLSPVSLSNLPSNEVRAIAEQGNGTLWVGTTSGLMRYNADGSYQLYNRGSGLPDNYVMTLTIDHLNQVWVGTGRGVAMITTDEVGKENVTEYDLAPFESAEYIFGFYLEEGYLWMTTDRGLIRYRYQDKTLSSVSRINGLPIDKLFQIVPDSSGYYWLTSNRGIWRVSMEDAHAVANGELDTIDFEHFSEIDGLPTAQLNGGSNPAAAVDSREHLWFATAKGVASTHPSRFRLLVTPSFPTVIETALSDKSDISVFSSRPVELEAGSQRIQFEFVGLGYISSHVIRYKTKLEGFESEWTERGVTGHAEFTNLPPGSYNFVVSAYYPYHPNYVNQANFAFTIAPYWWQRPVVQVGIVALFVMSMMLLVTWRIHLLHAAKLKLKKQVEEKTHELQLQASAFEQQAREDLLTGLPNRRAFDDWINDVTEHQSGESLSIVMLDLDHFKLVNDRFTHIAGDHVLRHVATILDNHTPSGAMMARWGGEEFVLGIVGWSTDDVYQICVGINNAIRSHDLSLVADGLSVTISIGMVTASTCHDFDELLRCADSALFEVKNSGRDGVSRYHLEDSEVEFEMN
ncbi:diguanylate cyclase [Vibrio tapetis subsp. quintayensis]|uniref:ligand-binding sensor domain-containing diguanylate cyclase n=1 Tax=Vibrio tapetis TaxID=52443 RepID=UPI0025B40291|nr:ligand-binding sensor domain-containing diguanylate cyclase [Vibrio tapetis]MDN3682879.1 diguanylate cyclase [Vibrio tapetis subsp. quintayensis]